MSAVSKRSTQVTCQLPANSGELASFFRWFESQHLNLRRIEVLTHGAPNVSQTFAVRLEMDAPLHFPAQIHSQAELLKLVESGL